jgi:hypothetical protein
MMAISQSFSRSRMKFHRSTKNSAIPDLVVADSEDAAPARRSGTRLRPSKMESNVSFVIVPAATDIRRPYGADAMILFSPELPLKPRSRSTPTTAAQWSRKAISQR